MLFHVGVKCCPTCKEGRCIQFAETIFGPKEREGLEDCDQVLIDFSFHRIQLRYEVKVDENARLFKI